MSLLLLVALASAAPTRAPDAKPLCQDTQTRLIAAKRKSGIHPLGQEPNADAVLTVLRSENGCSRPVKVREDIGARKR
ncbi:hypothetical protein KZ810_13830 [Sphingomonas sp. RHCKR47]|uniref:hypothetical protein n=1 Tax=Sphingomonas citricola TaxID=2862498 RepID=UPI001CA59EE9|nr:hypothetical protein [Sphingomonas citricola]MBW6524582.1 hypothetical protein [Sphingomonas citricola]